MLMTSFRINKKTYNIPQSYPNDSKLLTVASKRSKELEAAIAEGHYTRLATSVASKLPKNAFKYVADYIKAKHRKLYGGFAINQHLPTGHKIYKRSELPDYDFYSPDPWTDAVKIADILYNAGYTYTEARAGIHHGTFKVYADFWPVADITYSPPEIYNKIPAVKKNGFTVVTEPYLQMTMYNIISKPIEAPTRWPKVAYRQKLLQLWSPPKYRIKQCGSDFIQAGEKVQMDPVFEEVLDLIDAVARKSKLLYGGAVAYNKYVEIAKGKLRLPVYYYELFAQDAGKYAKRIKKQVAELITNPLISDMSYQAYKDINNSTFTLLINIGGENIPVCTITELTRCIPYKYIGGRRYCAIDYLFYELYNQMFFEETDEYSFNVSCLIRYLHYIQYNYYKRKGIHETDPSPLQRFVTKCQGPFFDVRREEFCSRWVNKACARAKITDILPQGDTVTLKGAKNHKIRVYPRNTEDCDKHQQDCVYPCTWDKNMNKCHGIPVTGYQPGQPGPRKVKDDGIVKLP